MVDKAGCLTDPLDLEKEGWQRRTVATEPRLTELVELYRDLGNEILLLPLLDLCGGVGGEDECTTCIENDDDPDKYKVIFTRKADEVA